MINIIYNNEIIDTVNNIDEALYLKKEYEIAFHTNDIEIVINNSIFENMKKIINDTEGKVINYTVDNNPDKIYYIGTLFGMKCFIDTTENSYSYQAYARYKKPNETKYHIENINFLDGMDDAIKRFFV